MKIEASVLSGTAYKPVDSWAFTQKYLDGGDIGTSADQSLSLTSIVHTGASGTTLTLDPVSFTYHDAAQPGRGRHPAGRRQHPAADQAAHRDDHLGDRRDHHGQLQRARMRARVD